MSAADGPALLANVVAHPADDAPRLVYADWLEERGEGGRAAFIRFQCALGPTWPVEVVAAAYDRASPRFAFLAGWPAGWDRAVVARGFAAEIRCPTAWWLAHGPGLIQAHPVATVWLPGKRPGGGTGASAGRFGWYRRSPDRAADDLPPALFDRLPAPDCLGVDEEHRWAWYLSADQATAALSAACLGWGRAAGAERPAG